MQSSSKSRNSGELWWPPGSSSCVISWLSLKGADSCITKLHTVDTCTRLRSTGCWGAWGLLERRAALCSSVMLDRQ